MTAVNVQPTDFWFRAWYLPDVGRLSLTRSGQLTKECVIHAAEDQFGLPWRHMYTKGIAESPGALIRYEADT